MNLYLSYHIICGIKYTEIQLLKIAGVQAIHPKLDRSSRIDMEVTLLENDTMAVVTIQSNEIIKLQVLLRPGKKLITNMFLLNRKSFSGVAVKIVKEQSDYVKDFNYNYLECMAIRDDNHKYKLYGVIHFRPLIGYRIWMKYGYVPTKDAQKIFDAFLDKHKKPRQTILNLVRNEEQFWKEHGESWDGIFDLSDYSESKKILREYLK